MNADEFTDPPRRRGARLSRGFHGTHVAGIATGNGATGAVSFSGVAKNAKLIAIQVFSEIDSILSCGGAAPCLGAYTADIISGLERVYALARSAKLELLQGEYRLEKPPFGIVFYRITLPIRGTYPQIRQFVAATLKSMPIASLDALRFERKKAGDSQLEAQLRLTIYFRPANEGEPP